MLKGCLDYLSIDLNAKAPLSLSHMSQALSSPLLQKSPDSSQLPCPCLDISIATKPVAVNISVPATKHFIVDAARQ